MFQIIGACHLTAPVRTPQQHPTEEHVSIYWQSSGAAAARRSPHIVPAGGLHVGILRVARGHTSLRRQRELKCRGAREACTSLLYHALDASGGVGSVAVAPCEGAAV